MAVKSTFTLDDVTVQTNRKIADREGKPQSLVVREAVAHYAAREEKTTPAERKRLLSTFDELVARVARRSRPELDRELADVTRSRGAGWTRRSSR